MNTPCIIKGNQVQFTVFRLTDAMMTNLYIYIYKHLYGHRTVRWPYKCLVKSTPFQREFDQEHATRSTTKLRENEKENKNSTF